MCCFHHHDWIQTNFHQFSSTFDRPEPIRISYNCSSSPLKVFCQTENCCSCHYCQYSGTNSFSCILCLPSFSSRRTTMWVRASLISFISFPTGRGLRMIFTFPVKSVICLDHAFIQTKMVSGAESFQKIFIDCIHKVNDLVCCDYQLSNTWDISKCPQNDEIRFFQNSVMETSPGQLRLFHLLAI